MLQIIFIAVALLLKLSIAAFDAKSKDNLVVYWGQNSAASQQRLNYYCQENRADLVILSFMTAFPGTNGVPSLNFANMCWQTFEGTNLLHCDDIASDIKTCQDNGVKILLSLGGASGAYGFSSEDEGKEFAHTLWDMFLEGSNSTVDRPFDDSIIDGFDLDIEDNQPRGYTGLVTELRSLFSDGSKEYYISAAPQCVLPDASLNTVMTLADIDFAFIQFYNNYCNIDKQFNYNDWVTWAETKAYNKDIKLYLGIPGNVYAAGSGYVDIDVIQSAVEEISCSEYFGGVSVWDASQVFGNTISSGKTYAAGLRDILDNDICQAGSSVSNSKTTTYTTSASATSALSTSGSTASTSSIQSIASTSTLARTTSTLSNTKSSSSSQASSSTSTIKYWNETMTSSNTETTNISNFPSTDSTFSTASITTDKTSSSADHSTFSTRSTLTTTIIPSSTASSLTECDSLIGLSKAKCLNNLYSEDYFAESQSSCSDGTIACTKAGQLSICDHGSWVNIQCAAGTTCYASNLGDYVMTTCNFIGEKSAFI